MNINVENLNTNYYHSKCAIMRMPTQKKVQPSSMGFTPRQTSAGLQLQTLRSDRTLHCFAAAEHSYPPRNILFLKNYLAFPSARMLKVPTFLKNKQTNPQKLQSSTNCNPKLQDKNNQWNSFTLSEQQTLRSSSVLGKQRTFPLLGKQGSISSNSSFMAGFKFNIPN